MSWLSGEDATSSAEKNQTRETLEENDLLERTRRGKAWQRVVQGKREEVAAREVE